MYGSRAANHRKGSVGKTRVAKYLPVCLEYRATQVTVLATIGILGDRKTIAVIRQEERLFEGQDGTVAVIWKENLGNSCPEVALKRLVEGVAGKAQRTSDSIEGKFGP